LCAAHTLKGLKVILVVGEVILVVDYSPSLSKPAACRLPPAACRLPPAACRLPPAACRLPPAGAKNNRYE